MSKCTARKVEHFVLALLCLSGTYYPCYRDVSSGKMLIVSLSIDCKMLELGDKCNVMDLTKAFDYLLVDVGDAVVSC